MKIRESKPPGTLWATPGLLKDLLLYLLLLIQVINLWFVYIQITSWSTVLTTHLLPRQVFQRVGFIPPLPFCVCPGMSWSFLYIYL